MKLTIGDLYLDSDNDVVELLSDSRVRLIESEEIPDEVGDCFLVSPRYLISLKPLHEYKAAKEIDKLLGEYNE
jgi:hypothetical protein